MRLSSQTTAKNTRFHLDLRYTFRLETERPPDGLYEGIGSNFLPESGGAPVDWFEETG